MKKSRLIIALIFTFVFSLLVVACKGNSNDIVDDGSQSGQIEECISHDYEDRGYIDIPTCTKKGLKLYVCVKCQKEKQETVEELSHEFDTNYSFDDEMHWFSAICGCDLKENYSNHNYSDFTEVVPSTCITPGLKQAECVDCGKIIEEVIEVKQHTYSNTLTYDTAGHWYDTTCGHDSKKDYNSHTFGNYEEYIPSGCETAGTMRRYCECGYFEEEPLTSTGHSYDSFYTYDEYNHWRQANCEHKELSIDYSSHSFGDWVEVTPVTCFENGQRKRECYCGYIEYDDIISNGHTYNESFTHNEEGHWRDATCGHNETIDYNSHSYGDWITIIPASCESDGEKYRVCVCGRQENEIIRATGHSYSNVYSYDDNTHWNDATCGHNVKGAETTHTFGDWQTVTPATCTENGTKYRSCVCGKIENGIIEANGHIYERGRCTGEGCNEWYSYGLIYENLTDTTVALVALGSNIYNSDIVIPEINENGKTVVEIKNDAFKGYYGAVTIADTIERIGVAFLDGQIDYIATKNNPYFYVTNGCLVEKSTKTIIKAVWDNSSIPTDIAIEKIGAYAFERANELNLVLSNSVTQIDQYAFLNANNLNIVISARANLDITAFVNSSYCNVYLSSVYNSSDLKLFTADCYQLRIYLYANIAPQTAGLFWCYDNNGDIVELNGAIKCSEGLGFELSSDGTYYIVTLNVSEDEIVYVPSSYYYIPVKVIGEYSFVSTSINTTEIILPNTIIEIKEYAFNGCLAKITLPNSVEKIGERALYYSGLALENDTLPSSLKEVGDYGLYSQNGGIVYVPNTLTVLGVDVFTGFDAVLCQASKKPSTWNDDWYTGYHYCFGVEDFGYFNNLIWAKTGGITIVSALNSSNNIYVPDTIEGVYVTNIVYGAFDGYGSVGNSVIDVTLPFLGTDILEEENASFHNVFGFESGENLSGWFINLNKVTLTRETIIGKNAFKYIPVKQINISNTEITKICEYAFAESGLESVSFPSTLLEIGNYAFYNNYNLTSVNYGYNHAIKKIGDYAFYGCINLELNTLPGKVEIIGDWAYASTSGKVYDFIKIPDNVQSVGLGAFNSVNMKQLITPFTGKGYDADETHVGYIFGEANPQVYNSGCIPNSLTTVTVTKQAEVKPYAFNTYSSHGITHVTYNTAITKIGEKAFYLCNALETFTFIDEVEFIGDRAFEGCISLGELAFSKVKNIGAYAFGDCISVNNLVLPNTIEFMGEKMLNGMQGTLETLTIPFVGSSVNNNGSLQYLMPYTNMTTVLESVTVTNAKSIGDSTFRNLTSLKTVNLNNEITYIGRFAFFGSVNITTLNLPNKLEDIGESAFDELYQYSFDKLPDTLTTIGKYAFRNTAVKGVLVIPASVVDMYLSFEGAIYNITKILCENYVQFYYHNFTEDFENFTQEIVVGYDNKTYVDDFRGVEINYVENDDGTITLTKYVGPYDVVLPETINGKVIRDIGRIFLNEPITSITIPSGVTRIKFAAFNACSYLESVKFAKNSNLKRIDYLAFATNNRLKEIVIPSSVEIIDRGAFWSNSNSFNIYLEHSSIPSTFVSNWNFKQDGDGESYNTYTYSTEETSGLTAGKYWYYNSNGEKITFTKN